MGQRGREARLARLSGGTEAKGPEVESVAPERVLEGVAFTREAKVTAHVRGCFIVHAGGAIHAILLPSFDPRPLVHAAVRAVRVIGAGGVVKLRGVHCYDREVDEEGHQESAG